MEAGDCSSLDLEDLEQEGEGWQGSSYCSLVKRLQERLGEGFLLEGEGPPSKVVLGLCLISSVFHCRFSD